MSAPDPYKYRKSILCLVTQATQTEFNFNKLACAPDEYPLNVAILPYSHATGSWDDVTRFTVNNIEEWGAPIKSVHDLGDTTGDFGGSYLVSVHNKSVLQRAAWWWSRVSDYDWSGLNIFSEIRRQEDVVDLYNGPAIVTAEERYAFSIEKTCSNLGIDYEGDKLLALCDIWKTLIK